MGLSGASHTWGEDGAVTDWEYGRTDGSKYYQIEVKLPDQRFVMFRLSVSEAQELRDALAGVLATIPTTQ